MRATDYTSIKDRKYDVRSASKEATSTKAGTQRTYLKLSVLAAILLASVVVVAVIMSGEDAPVTPSDSVALGAYIPNARQDPAKIDEFTNQVGASPAIVMWFQSWDRSGVKEFDAAGMDAVVSRGAMPMVTWEPWDSTRGKKQPKYALRRIIAGQHDRYIEQWARDAAKWGKPMYLRFAHEMNGDWYPWSPGVNGNTSAEYVTAWRHVVDIFRQEGATNVRWVWSPVVDYNGTTPFDELYPGDNYVDWVGLSGHNFGTSQSWSSWRSLAELFGPSYDEITALAPSKPFMIPEISSSEVGGDKAAWIRDAFGTDIPTRLPATRAVVWFNKDKVTNWPVDSSPSSLAAYSEVVASPAYQGRLP